MKKHVVVIMLILIMLFSTVTCFGATDPAVTIVNPTGSSTIYSTNLLISVRLSKPTTIRVTVTEEKKKINETLYPTSVEEIIKAEAAFKEGLTGSTIVGLPYGTIDTYTSSNYLSFYTKKYEKVNPGVYRIKVETLSQGQVIYWSENLVTIKEKEPEATNAAIFSANQSGATQFLQNLLKTIFGN